MFAATAPHLRRLSQVVDRIQDCFEPSGRNRPGALLCKPRLRSFDVAHCRGRDSASALSSGMRDGGVYLRPRRSRRSRYGEFIFRPPGPHPRLDVAKRNLPSGIGVSDSLADSRAHGDRALFEYTKQDARAFLENLCNGGGAKHGRPQKARSTLKKELGHLRSFFQ